MGKMFEQNPAEWKNIALPVVDCITVLLQETYKLHLYHTDQVAQTNHKIDKLKKDVQKIDRNLDGF